MVKILKPQLIVYFWKNIVIPCLPDEHSVWLFHFNLFNASFLINHVKEKVAKTRLFLLLFTSLLCCVFFDENVSFNTFVNTKKPE